MKSQRFHDFPDGPAAPDRALAQILCRARLDLPGAPHTSNALGEHSADVTCRETKKAAVPGRRRGTAAGLSRPQGGGGGPRNARDHWSRNVTPRHKGGGEPRGSSHTLREEEEGVCSVTDFQRKAPKPEERVAVTGEEGRPPPLSDPKGGGGSERLIFRMQPRRRAAKSSTG